MPLHEFKLKQSVAGRKYLKSTVAEQHSLYRASLGPLPQSIPYYNTYYPASIVTFSGAYHASKPVSCISLTARVARAPPPMHPVLQNVLSGFDCDLFAGLSCIQPRFMHLTHCTRRSGPSPNSSRTTKRTIRLRL